MTDFVSLLGVKGGPAIRPGSNMPTSLLLCLNGQTILVDAGLGVSKAVCDQGVDLAEIDAIFITHLHSDHYLELGPLIHTSWVAGRTRPLVVYGPSRLQHYWDSFLVAMEDDVQLRIVDEGRVDLANMVACETIRDGDVLSVGGVAVQVLRNDHPPIAESFALRFDWGDKAVVLSGDTAYLPAMGDFAQGADLLVHEAMLVDGVDAVIQRTTNGDERLKHHILRSHTAADDVGRIAAAAGVKQLALHHFVPDGFPAFTDKDWEAGVRKTWDGPLTLGRDGLRITL